MPAKRHLAPVATVRLGASRLAAALLALHPASHLAAAAETPRFADFVYVDANEGSASGGHFALRLEDRTYHFGYHESGHLRLDRDDSERFAHVYGTLENRNLELRRVAVSEETFDRLRTSFNTRWLVESAEFETLAELARDRALLDAWAEGRPAVEVRAAAYFRLSDPTPVSSRALDRLRARIRAEHGEEGLEERRRDALASLERLRAEASSPIRRLATAGHHPAGGYGLSRRASEAQAVLDAIAVLERGARLEPSRVARLEPADFPLDAAGRAVLQRRSASLEADLASLVGSARPDAGFALLVGLARLLAMERSLDEGRLVLLDVYPADSVRLTVAEIEARGGQLAVLAGEVRSEIGRVRSVLLQEDSLREADYAALEVIGNRLSEIERSRATGRPLRAARSGLLPAAAATRFVALGAPPPAPVVARRVAELESREAELRARLDAELGYELLTRNCVSELFAQVERAVGGEDEAAGSIAQLGGHLPPGRGLAFIPFVAADAVGRTYRVAAVERVPSHRRRRVDALVEREGSLAAVRESNVLTSTVYRPNALDSSFLFFTDGAPAVRPLLGAANLVYGVGATVVGVALVPFDGGDRLGAGLRGVLWSVPELGFVNVRKGSFFHVPGERDVPLDAGGVQSPAT